MNKKLVIESEKKSLEIRSWVSKTIMFVFLWNLSSFVFILIKSVKNPNFWNLNYGDLYRTDLGYLIAIGSFPNPYEYHPELPQISVTNYLPLPFLVFKLFNIKIVNTWDKNSLSVLSYVIVSISLLFLIIFISMKGYNTKDRVLASIAFGILSVPSLYIFSTANTQALVTFLVFLAFLPLLSIKPKNFLSQKSGFFKFFSFISVFSFKPNYIIFNLSQYFPYSKNKIKQLSIAFVVSIIFVFIGFALFPGGVLNNFLYFAKSLNQFTSSNTQFVVHNNISIIGNFSAIEVFLNPLAINSSMVIRYKTLIIILYTIATLLLAIRLYFKKAPNWIITWILGGLVIIATPVSFAYSFTTILIPLGLFFKDVYLKEVQTIDLLTKKSVKIFFVCAIWLTFCPKFLEVTLVPEYADTNLYAMFSSLSHICILVIALFFLQQRQKNRTTERSTS